MAEPKKREAWTDEAVEELVWNLLDQLKEFDPVSLKAWVRETYPDPDEVYP